MKKISDKNIFQIKAGISDCDYFLYLLRRLFLSFSVNSPASQAQTYFERQAMLANITKIRQSSEIPALILTYYFSTTFFYERK